MKKRVLVTGANGHLGYNLVSLLSQQGYPVLAGVRDLNDPKKTDHLRSLKGVHLVLTEIMDPLSLEASMENVDAVFHVAAPNFPWAMNAQKEIVQPIFEGTQNVFLAAQKKNVRKIIFTSSCAALGMHAKPTHPLTENDWNLTSQSPLLRSKIDAEKWAWNFTESSSLKMVSICPPSIVGPGFHRHTLTTKIYEKIVLGKLPPLPEGGCHMVDVRDVADAHIKAYTHPSANGRYAVAGRFFKISDFIKFLKQLDPSLRLPKVQLPKWSLQFLRAADWVSHQVTGQPRQVTKELIEDFSGKYQYVSTAKAVSELAWNPRPAEETVLDTFDWIKKRQAIRGNL